MELRQPRNSETVSDERKPRVLLADDEAVSRRLLSESLRRSGFDVQQAADGEEALRLATNEPPDLLVLDFEMPQLDGAEVCRKLRACQQEELQNLPIIMLTAHAGEEEEISCLEAGANDFVTKPVSRDVLAARIQTQLRLRSLGYELRQRNEELARWRTDHEADLAAAHATQQVLIPTRPPTAEGWTVESIYQPVIEIGGDVFGWRAASGGYWHFWLVDATGHGAAAALFTALATQLFRQSCETERAPGAILSTVNHEFRKVFGGRAFMSGCCALVGPQGDVTFSGAGHPPLFVRRVNGNVDAFGPHGTLLGLKDGLAYEENHTTLEAGDVAVLYSDGLFSFKTPEGERFTPAKLRDALRGVTPGIAFFDRLLTTVRGNSNGGESDDDIAAIALQRS